MKLVKSIWVASVAVLGAERVATLHSHVSKQVSKANVLSSETFLDGGLPAIKEIGTKRSALTSNKNSKVKKETKISSRGWNKLTMDFFKRFVLLALLLICLRLICQHLP